MAPARDQRDPYQRRDQGDHRVEIVLVGSKPDEADSRYAAFDEPAAFRVQLENYSVVDAQEPRLLLARRPPRTLTETRLATERSAIGRVDVLPAVAEGSVCAYIDMRFGTVGGLLSLAYKPPPAAVTLDYASSQHRFYHFVPAVAADGLFVSA